MTVQVSTLYGDHEGQTCPSRVQVDQGSDLHVSKLSKSSPSLLSSPSPVQHTFRCWTIGHGLELERA